VQSVEKWGIWAAIFQVTMGIAFAALAIAFGYCLKCVADFVGNAQNPGMPQVPNLIWQGFVLGLVFGAISGYLLFKGAHLVVQAIEMFRGDKTYTLLVRYHDGIMNMMEDEREGLGNPAIGKPLREEDHESTKGRKHEEE
jgi:hypothetical protein